MQPARNAARAGSHDEEQTWNFFLQPLTLLTFFPLVGVLVLLFVRSENKNALRWTALVTSLITFVISLWVLALFNASNPDLQLVARVPLDHRRRLEHRISPRRRWAEHPARAAHHVPDAALHPLHLDGGGRPRQGLHALLPAARNRHDRRVPGAGPVPVLHLLGIHAGADVLPDRHLGRTAAHLRGAEVLPVHDGGLDPDAAGDPVAGRSTRAPSRCRT